MIMKSWRNKKRIKTFRFELPRIDGRSGTDRFTFERIERTPGNLSSDVFFIDENNWRCQIYPVLEESDHPREWMISRGLCTYYLDIVSAIRALNDFHEGTSALWFDYLPDVCGPDDILALEAYELLFDEEKQNLELCDWVYLFKGKQKSNGRIIHKIGFTAGEDGWNRLKGVTNKMDQWITEIEPVAKRRGNRKLETFLHELFADYQVPPLTINRKTEWFHFPSERMAVDSFLNGSIRNDLAEIRPPLSWGTFDLIRRKLAVLGHLDVAEIEASESVEWPIIIGDNEHD